MPYQKLSSISEQTIVYGYAGSTIETLANQCGRTFIPLDEPSVTTTTPISGGSTRFTLSNLNMKTSDVLHLNVSGDAGDTIQVYFYYTDEDGNASSTIVGGLGGTVLDSNGRKTVDFTAPNDMDSVTVKIVYNKSNPTYTYSVDHKTITTTTTTTTTTTNPSQLHAIQWGRDNWNFTNWSTYFTHYNTYISQPYWDRLRSNLDNVDWEIVKKWQAEEWGGSCYGMSSLVVLGNAGLLPYSNWTPGADCLYEMETPVENTEIESLINYYQLLQVKDVIQQQYWTVPSRSNQENIQELLSLLENDEPVLVGFKKDGWGGHAIIAYDVNYGSWTWNGVTYQGCIEVLDPNHSMSYDNTYCIYFNTSTYNWTIPHYTGITSTNGAVFDYIGNNIDEINEGGYLSGTSYAGIINYIARLDTAAISDNHSVQKVKYTGNQFVNQNTAADDILPDISYYANGESEGMPGYLLKDAEAGYRISQMSAVPMDLSLKYENCLLEASSAAGKEVIFDKDGYVSVAGEAADYVIRMVYNEGHYTTDWYTMQVSGSNADDVVMRQTEDGYLLHADNLQNVSASAYNDDFTADVTFSTDYTDVLLYEIDEETIGVAVDIDGNGTYETTIAQSSEETEEIMYGDINLDGIVNLADSIIMNKYLAKIVQFSDFQAANANCYQDNTIDEKDANTLIEFVILLIDILPVKE